MSSIQINQGESSKSISELKKKTVILLLRKEKIATKKPCGICLKTNHHTDICPLLEEDVAPVKNQQQQNFQNLNFQNQNSHQQPSSSSVALKDITETRASIKNLEQQVSQLATFVGHVEAQGKSLGHT
uniref:Uncharacterized protein n=1 Tax=Lactuca sativa TaxID=4236 RepID=A0A9R1XKF1_LACSA|nr:hypothetical protein LSAT_V11C300150560 [Lactuca sativa]